MLDVAVDRTVLAEAVLAHLAARIGSWRAAAGVDATLAADYRSRSVTIGGRVRASLPGDRTVEGVATDIDESAACASTSVTRSLTVSAGDITHLRPVNPIEFARGLPG